MQHPLCSDEDGQAEDEADDYIGAGLKLRVQRDHYTHTDRVEVYDPPHEESSSSGGSSVDSDGFGGSSGGSF